MKLFKLALPVETCATLLVAVLAFSPEAAAQRRIIGATDDEEESTGAAPPAADEKADDKKAKDKKSKDKKAADEKAGDTKAAEKKADEKKADDKKVDDKKAGDTKAEEKKVDDKKAVPDTNKTDAKKDAKKDPKNDPKKDDKRDVLDDTPEETAKRAKDDAARSAAEKAAEAAAEAEKKKKEDDQRKLLEEKKAADEKKKLENKDHRLAAARKVRNISRSVNGLGLSFAIEPGEVKANSVIEIRLDVTQKLDVADPRYGNLMPLKGLDLVATVSQPTGKKDAGALRYQLHPLESAGRYGFHTTPLKDGLYQVTVRGTTKEGKSVEGSFPLHVGVWPPPDFDDEEKNNLATTDASRAGRKVLVGN